MVSLHNYVCLLPAFALLLPFLSLSDFFLLPGVHGNVYLWPMPQVVEWGSGPAILLSRDFHFQSPENAVLDKAVVEYKELIRTERWLPIHRTEEEEKEEEEEEEEEETLVIVESMEALVVLESLAIVVLDLEADLQHGVDESYTIEIPESSLAVVGTGVRSAPSSLSASILAATVWGALHGLETFSQLIHRGTSPETCLELFIDHGVYIRDQPNFPHRGLLLDTARNFYPVESILRTIRVMAYNKLNVFHWHITDSHSFPLELFKEPELAKKGAYSERHRYSHMDVKRVLEYATQHGVRIIPELDMPGHTGSWSGAYPEVVTCHDQFWLQPGAPWGLRMASEPGWPGQLNPLHPLTYKVVKNLVEEVASLFPDNFFHGGGDEVNPNCWNNSLDIQEYVLAGGNMSTLLEEFVITTHPYITGSNKTAVYWEDLLTNRDINVPSTALPKETTILQTWNNGAANTKLLTSNGYRTIVSSSDFYYLDCGHGGWVGNDSRYDEDSNDPGNPFNYPGGNGGSWCGPFKTWARIYDYDITFNLTNSEAALVIGAEVSLWSEQADATVLDSRLWPRTAALAESLWSGNKHPDGKKRYAQAIDRLNDWRFRLVSRGISAEPLQPLWCVKHPGQCNINT